MDNRDKGLYPKYYVQKIEGNDLLEVKDWVFVLNPRTDPGAVKALDSYIEWCWDNGYESLALDLEAILDT